MTADLTDEEYRVWELFACHRAKHDYNLGIRAARGHLGYGGTEISVALKKLVDKNLLEYSDQWGYSVVGLTSFMKPIIFQYLEARTSHFSNNNLS